MVSLLIIDDEKDWLHGITRTLAAHKIAQRKNIFRAETAADALAVLERQEVDLVLLDLYLECGTGDDLLERILAVKPSQTVVMMTGSDSVENAVTCMRKGAKDYFVKSTPVDDLMANIRRVLKITELERENESIKKAYHARVGEYDDFSEFITNSAQMFDIFAYVKKVAQSSQHILITGESGVGKGVLAAIAARLSRPGKPFVSANVAGYDDHMFADALFGHVKGAYTGAETARDGMVLQTGDGVLFLDEIGDLSMPSQIKLLYLLQDGRYQALGSDKALQAGAKFILASNKDLALKVRQNTFRSDLFFRLNTHRVHIPALRERKEDIPLLVRAFAVQAADELQLDTPAFTDRFMERVSRLSLPGNIRQLKSIIYDLTTRHNGIIDEEHLLAMRSVTDFMDDHIALPSVRDGERNGELPTIDAMTNALVLKAMDQAGGNQIKAAQLLGISQPTLSRRLKKIQAHTQDR